MFTDSNLQSPPSFTNPNLQPLNLELTPEREQSLIEFADWWGDRMIVTTQDLNAFPGYQKLQTKYGKGYPYYTLLTHNCGNDEKKRVSLN